MIGLASKRVPTVLVLFFVSLLTGASATEGGTASVMTFFPIPSALAHGDTKNSSAQGENESGKCHEKTLDA